MTLVNLATSKGFDLLRNAWNFQIMTRMAPILAIPVILSIGGSVSTSQITIQSRSAAAADCSTPA